MTAVLRHYEDDAKKVKVYMQSASYFVDKT